MEKVLGDNFENDFLTNVDQYLLNLSPEKQSELEIIGESCSQTLQMLIIIAQSQSWPDPDKVSP